MKRTCNWYRNSETLIATNRHTANFAIVSTELNSWHGPLNYCCESSILPIYRWRMNILLSTVLILLGLPDVGRDSSVGIATRYGLDGPGSNLGRGEIFRNRPDRPWGPPSLLYRGCRVIPGDKAAGVFSVLWLRMRSHSTENFINHMYTLKSIL